MRAVDMNRRPLTPPRALAHGQFVGTVVGSGKSGRLIVGELGAFNDEIEVLGSVRGAIEEHQSTAFENTAGACCSGLPWTARH
ncbi:MAG: hypothetical protein OXC31_13270 [Spirochaetaceae bacterium]|nr:hypothetical protein [Spirochaetaceae bacterium]